MFSNSFSSLRSALNKRPWLWAIVLPLWAFAALLIGLGLSSLVFLGAQLFGLSDIVYRNSPFIQMLVSIAVFGGMLAVLIAVPYKLFRSPTTKAELGVNRWMTYSDIGWSLIAFLGYVVVSVVLLQFAKAFLPWFNATEAQDLGLDVVSPGLEMAITFTLLVVIMPILEELIFRGYLYGKLRTKQVPIWAAALVVSVVFAGAHGQWNVAFDTFALGLVLVLLREKTGSIWAGTVLHMLKNAIAFYIVFGTKFNA